MKILTPEQVALLKQPLDPKAISQHPTKTFLSSIKAIYVAERLNLVFGIGAWNLKSEIIDNKTSMIVVKGILTIPEYGIELESFGGNNNGGENSKNFDLGDAYKGASTDALTKICSYLEIGIDVFKGLSNNTGYNQPQSAQTSSYQRPVASQTPSNQPAVGSKCPECGANMAKSMAGKIYCSNKCWLPENAHLKQPANNGDVNLDEQSLNDLFQN